VGRMEQGPGGGGTHTNIVDLPGISLSDLCMVVAGTDKEDGMMDLEAEEGTGPRLHHGEIGVFSRDVQ